MLSRWGAALNWDIESCMLASFCAGFFLCIKFVDLDKFSLPVFVRVNYRSRVGFFTTVCFLLSVGVQSGLCMSTLQVMILSKSVLHLGLPTVELCLNSLQIFVREGVLCNSEFLYILCTWIVFILLQVTSNIPSWENPQIRRGLLGFLVAWCRDKLTERLHGLATAYSY